jgi:lipid-A-disaccharide synthase-like uncharacterized protein
MHLSFQRRGACMSAPGWRETFVDGSAPGGIMPPRRRASDKRWVAIVGWVACIALAGSLTYTFIRALSEGTSDIDPVFFGLQALASTLFLVYSVRLRNGIFIAANTVAVLNAVGTLVLTLAARSG